MRIYVSARPGSKASRLEKINENHFKVYVKEPPVRGLANFAITKLLAAHFKVEAGRVRISRGQFSKEKIVDVLI